MATKKTMDNRMETSEDAGTEDSVVEVFTSQQEVIDELRMGRKQFMSLIKKYPFYKCGSSGKLNGRWHVTKSDLWRWHGYVQKQELRHPESRRMRPEEPPELTDMRARS